MQIEFIAHVLGLTLIGVCLLRAMIAASFYAGQRLMVARRQRQLLKRFRAHVSNQLDSFGKHTEPSPKQRTQGLRSLRLARRIVENEKGDIVSFYFVPADGAPLPSYRPGQFLTLQIQNGCDREPVTRCYSLSDRPADPQSCYRITVKRQEPAAPGEPAGVVSSYLHDHLHEGDIVEAFPPAGSFYLNHTSDRPVVLVVGGVGITPVLSMLSWLIATRSSREIWLLYGVRNRCEHPFYDHLNASTLERHNVRSVVFYSQPTSRCRKGIDYDVDGHVSVSLMKSALAQRSYEFYLCGPAPFMQTVTNDLLEWGVPLRDIATESFGPSTASRPSFGKALAAVSNAAPRAEGFDAEARTIEFVRSGKVVKWTRQAGSLLELAELSGVKPKSACRAGQCGTCRVAIQSGEVACLRQPGVELAHGDCLLCISQPKSDLVLDL